MQKITAVTFDFERDCDGTVHMTNKLAEEYKSGWK